MKKSPFVRFLGGLVLTLAGCSSSSTAPTGTSLLSVSPVNATSNVSPGASMVLTFSAPMAAGMEQYVDLHLGTLAGSTMPMTCTWSANATILTCTPNAPLAGGTGYQLHCGGGMKDGNGNAVAMMTGPMAGTMVTTSMAGGMHAGQPMGMMGAGWQGPGGTYGMMFSFTTQ